MLENSQSGMLGTMPQPQIKEQEEVEAQEEQQEEENSVYTMLQQLGGPSKEKIEEWKKQWGDVHLVPFSEDDMYVIRTLNRGEWNQMKNMFAQAAETMTDDQRKEYIVNRCLLWPEVDQTQYVFLKAGVPDSLYEAVSFTSGFMSQGMIISLLTRL